MTFPRGGTAGRPKGETMKKTALTTNILDHFEELVSPELFTESGIEKIELLAYSAEMSAHLRGKDESGWELFCAHIARVFGIDLVAIEESKKKAALEKAAYNAFWEGPEGITVHNVTESEGVTVTVFTFGDHTFELIAAYEGDVCKLIA